MPKRLVKLGRSFWRSRHSKQGAFRILEAHPEEFSGNFLSVTVGESLPFCRQTLEVVCLVIMNLPSSGPFMRLEFISLTRAKLDLVAAGGRFSGKYRVEKEFALKRRSSNY